MQNLLRHIQIAFGPVRVGISTISVIELIHGAYRARTDADRFRRPAFADAATDDLTVYPVTLEIAQLAGRMDGEQGAKGIAIPFEDLVIGATGLCFGFDVLTHNVRHFQLIPGLSAVTL